MGNVDAFVDHGFEAPSLFARAFFNSPDFSVLTLRRILRIGINLKKEDLAREVWRQLDDGSLEAGNVLRYWAHQSRRWLSLRLGIPTQTPTLGSPVTLLTQFGEPGWHGP